MTEHTPTPWNAATKYSSVVGVPIVNTQGKRIGNTALPDMPAEWDHLKRQAEIDAAFICIAVNNHDTLVKALHDVIPILKACRMSVGLGPNQLARIAKAEAVLAAVAGSGGSGK